MYNKTNKQDISGKKFGKLIAIKSIGQYQRCYIWLCKCKCGNITKVKVSMLNNGHTKSCGCLHKKTKNIFKLIIQEYLKGKATMYLAKKYKVHRATIQRVLLKNNIKLRSQDITARKKFFVNDISKIDTQEKAYILGLIYSDGTFNKHGIEISLIKKDEQILKNISNYVYGKNWIKYRKGRWINFRNKGKILWQKPQARFSITSKKVALHLRRIGLMENKSLKIRFPKLKNKFISHFIRGYFDGDGCIFISKKYLGTNRVTMVSNYLFCQDLKNVIEKNLPINVRVYSKTKTVADVSICGNKQIRRFMEWIYIDAKLKLKRKYKKFIKTYPKRY